MPHRSPAMRPIDSLPAAVRAATPCVWINPHRRPAAHALDLLDFERADIEAAVARWQQFAPLLAQLFPEVQATHGAIDSALVSVPETEAAVLRGTRAARVLIKADHDLPVTGCIKARGGVYEVLVHAQHLAVAAGLLQATDDCTVLATAAARQLFAQHCVVVGSTGNLGFSVGLMARTLGFQVEVHMSSDAKEWKKERLRRLGAQVVEHAQDYGAAVASARQSAAARPHCYFVDDEHSVPLFLGYSAAAFDLQRQLAQAHIAVDAEHPLVVFLPCGVGGAPGGIAFGLKHLWGDAVRCVFVEPVASPCMLIQLALGTQHSVSVYDAGLDNRTAADGLAVGSASLLVARAMEPLLDAVVTVADDALFVHAERLHRSMGLRLEPSAAAGFAAVQPYLQAAPLPAGEATLVVWTTGGALLPDAEFEAVLARGRALALAPQEHP